MDASMGKGGLERCREGAKARERRCNAGDHSNLSEGDLAGR